MYQSHERLFYNSPYGQEDYFYSIPYQSQSFHPASFEERQFGQWPFPGGPMGPPSGQPGFPPPFGSPGQGPDVGAPTTPPPSFVPAEAQQATAFAVDPGSIRGCLFRFTYLWLRNRQQFWYFPTFVGQRSVSGYRWNGFRWVFFGVSLREIRSFTCV
jgi:hypothetical protein